MELAELTKLVQSATEACSKAEDGDAAEERRALDILKLLEKKIVTAVALTTTQAGRNVKKFTKHPAKSIAVAANAVVDAWKACVRAGTLASQPSGEAKGDTPMTKAGTSGTDTTHGAGGRGSTAQHNESAPGTSGSQPSELPRSNSGKVPAEPITAKPRKCGDETRDKVRLLFAESLVAAANAGVATLCDDPNVIAAQIEEAMFATFGAVNAEYKTKARSLSFNLKDPKNPDLRLSVLAGDIPPKQLVTMTAEEMASEEHKKKMNDMREALLKEAVRSNTSQASTDMFQCGRCKQRKCTYYQMQTRSADEPMTTFVTCINCNNRWKFC